MEYELFVFLFFVFFLLATIVKLNSRRMLVEWLIELVLRARLSHAMPSYGFYLLLKDCLSCASCPLDKKMLQYTKTRSTSKSSSKVFIIMSIIYLILSSIIVLGTQI